MSGKLTVHFRTLLDAADELEDAVRVLEKQAKQLDHRVLKVAESWHGEAKTVFDEHYKQWNAANRDLHRHLRTLHKTLHTAHGNYHAARAANLRTWGQ